MAEASGARADPEPFPDEVTFDGDETEARRPSTSTNASRRQSYYDTQRIIRRSRPTSGASQATQATSKSKGKRASYQQPPDFENLDEQAIPAPAGPEGDRRGLEEAQGGSTSSALKSKREGEGARRRSSAASRRHDPSEDPNIPPVPQRNRASLEEARASRPIAGGDVSDDSNGPYRPRTADDVLQSKKQQPPVPRLLTQLYTASYLIFFSIMGTLARLGVQWLTFYPGAPLVTPVIWANFGGSLFLGFLAEDQALFRDRAQVSVLREKYEDDRDFHEAIRAESSGRKKTIPLYIGLATGFCGSFTSFSSFMRDVFLALSNNLPTPFDHNYPTAGSTTTPSTTVSRNGGYSFEALVAVIISTIALSLGGLIVGAHLALSMRQITPTIQPGFARKVLDPLMVLLGWGSWLGAIFMTIWPPDRPGGPSSRGSWSNEQWRGEVLFALVFAPAGCLLRFYASITMNGLVAAFPLGTFAVNMFGTAVEAMSYDIQHVGVGVSGLVGGGRVGCQVLQGIMDGFCGCLTTVSTWVAEINALQRRHGYIYAFGSVLGGFCLVVVIMGSVRWTVGFSSPVCNTGYPSKIYG